MRLRNLPKWFSILFADELNKNNYEVIKADDVINNKVSLNDFKKYVITIDGSELSRGGGGARCMTMPVRRKDVQW